MIDDTARRTRLAIAIAKIQRWEDKPYFVCPDCCTFSPNPNDVDNSYCFRCHAFKAESYMEPRCFEPTCIDFGSWDFGEGTCPAKHALPPAHRDR